MSHRIIIADVMDGLAQLDDESVQCIVTSPPYWNLRNYGVDGQIGLEPTISEYVEKMRDVFCECKRVLRNDGTLWLNLGDSYQGGGGAAGHTAETKNLGKTTASYGATATGGRVTDGLKPKDLCGIPWRTAFALQDDGWYLRKDIIWAKPNPMPESVRDRPTSAHEYIFLLTKSPRYFYDADAIREPVNDGSVARAEKGYNCAFASQFKGSPTDKRHQNGKVIAPTKKDKQRGHGRRHDGFNDRWDAMPKEEQCANGANARSVWTIATEPYSGSHYAVFPSELPRRCILAGTSAAGACVACGSPHERVVNQVPSTSKSCPKTQSAHEARGGTGTPVGTVGKSGSGRINGYIETLGWAPTCKCDAETMPCTVLDPFAGSGTTIQVAIELGRNVIGIDLDERNRALIEQRILGTTPPLFAQ